MGSLRTFLAAPAAAFALAAPQAMAVDGAELGRAFADCAGRYSAYTEYLWAADGPASEAAARRRDMFVELVEAAAPGPGPEADRAALSLRVAAKAAQRALLDGAAYATDAEDRARAARIALGYIDACDRLLPAG
jgi:hypothetical protein